MAKCCRLGDPNFIKQLIHFDKENMSDRVLKKIGQYTSQPDFEPVTMGRVSQAARSLCMWVCAMEVYGRVYRVIEPKRQRLSQATRRLEKTQAELAEAKARLQEVQDRIEDLKKQYDEKLARKEELRKSAELTELKLERAGKLVSGLAGERERWKASVAVSGRIGRNLNFHFTLRRTWKRNWVTWWAIVSLRLPACPTPVRFCLNIERI